MSANLRDSSIASKSANRLSTRGVQKCLDPPPARILSKYTQLAIVLRRKPIPMASRRHLRRSVRTRILRCVAMAT
ncbi:hypothetical protein KC367_g88 [Hortaea werneckii]|nr:hypothetical protein KC367_g88 [Hortaea werneckii]